MEIKTIDKASVQAWTGKRQKLLGISLEKTIQKEADGSIIVRGFFTSDNKDVVGDIITRSATEKAIPLYRQWGNIRYMHLPRPVGRVVRIGVDDGLEWNEIEIRVIDPQAVFEVEQGLLQALSVGILFSFEDIDFLEDGGLVINNYLLAEISLVDHPANYDAVLSGVKSMLCDLARCEGIESVISRVTGLANELRADLMLQDTENNMEQDTKNAAMETEPEVEPTSDNLEETKTEPVVKSEPCREEGESEEDCVDRKVPEILDENPEMDQDQAVAIAEDMCEEPCEDKGLEPEETQDTESAVNSSQPVQINNEETPAAPAQAITPLTVEVVNGLSVALQALTEQLVSAMQLIAAAGKTLEANLAEVPGLMEQAGSEGEASQETELEEDEVGKVANRSGGLQETILPVEESVAEAAETETPTDLRQALRRHLLSRTKK